MLRVLRGGSSGRHGRCARWRGAGFTLIELLVVAAVLAVLVSVLLPALGAARGQARRSVCASNVRQVAIANLTYATENGGRYCPGAPGMARENRRRWHGTRTNPGAAFDPERGPLARHLGGDGRVRACPSFAQFVRAGAAAFELGGGGYGYNQAYLGRVLRQTGRGGSQVITDELGAPAERVRRPAETLMFVDTAFAALECGLIEYSFAEPRFQPESGLLQYRADPSLHFRHAGLGNVAWCDGHVDRRERTFTWRSGLYPGDPEREGIGWFGREDDNGFFDLE
ncbi:MAG: prepilin-type N-terminal cleavage/methylation domain-containing protein [Planctomycetota bacterium]